MNFDWYQYELVAHYIAGGRVDPESIEDEARFRVAISRAYYSALHTARDYIEIHLGLILREGNSVHTQVINTYRDDDDPIYIEIGENLNRLKQLRVEADYDKTVYDIRTKTKDAFVYVRSIRERIDSLKNT